MKKSIYLSSASFLGLILLASSFISSSKNSSFSSRSSGDPGPRSVKAKYAVDKNHSSVRFTVTHMMVSEVEGRFTRFDGTIESAKSDLSDAKIAFSVDVHSINTESVNRDNHLKGDEFFSADKFPRIKFESTAFTPQGGKKYKLEGNLTIRDVTKAVVFDVTYGGSMKNKGTNVMGFKAVTKINRFDYDLKWDKGTEAGGLVVGKDVDIAINVEMNEAK